VRDPDAITGQNGSDAIFRGAADFDLELIESRTLDGNIQEVTYRPTLHVRVHPVPMTIRAGARP
jgi:hypothetical protein